MQNKIHSIRIHTDRQTQQCLNCYPSKLSKIKISHWVHLNSRTSKCDRSTKPGAPICSLPYPCEYSVKQIIYCKMNKPLFMSVTEKDIHRKKERILMEMSTQNSSSFKSCVDLGFLKSPRPVILQLLSFLTPKLSGFWIVEKSSIAFSGSWVHWERHNLTILPESWFFLPLTEPASTGNVLLYSNDEKGELRKRLSWYLKLMQIWK